MGRLRLRRAAPSRPQAQEALVAGDWPGNVRELENVVGRGALRAARSGPGFHGAIVVGLEHLDVARPASTAFDPRPEAKPPAGPPLTLAERIDAFRRREILAAVERCRGNWAAAARELGLHRSNLHHLSRRLGIKDAGPGR